MFAPRQPSCGAFVAASLTRSSTTTIMPCSMRMACKELTRAERRQLKMLRKLDEALEHEHEAAGSVIDAVHRVSDSEANPEGDAEQQGTGDDGEAVRGDPGSGASLHNADSSTSVSQTRSPKAMAGTERERTSMPRATFIHF